MGRRGRRLTWRHALVALGVVGVLAGCRRRRGGEAARPGPASRSTAARLGGYVADAWGGVHAFGGAPAVTSDAYWPGRDLARGSRSRTRGGWLLDAWGGLHPFGGAPRSRVRTGPAWTWRAPWRPRPVAVAGCSTRGVACTRSAARRRCGRPVYWPGHDLARARGRGPGGRRMDRRRVGRACTRSAARRPMARRCTSPGLDFVHGALADRGARRRLGGRPVRWRCTRSAVHATSPVDAHVTRRRLRPWRDRRWLRRPAGGCSTPGAGCTRSAGPRPSPSAYWPGRDLALGGHVRSRWGERARPLPARRPRPPVLRTVTYTIAVRGAGAVERRGVRGRGRRHATTTNAGGRPPGFEFVRVPAGGELTVWLVAGRRSCRASGRRATASTRAGRARNAIINDDRSHRIAVLAGRARRLPPHGHQPRDRPLDRVRALVLLGPRPGRAGDDAAVEGAPRLRHQPVAAGRTRSPRTRARIRACRRWLPGSRSWRRRRVGDADGSDQRGREPAVDRARASPTGASCGG